MPGRWLFWWGRRQIFDRGDNYMDEMELKNLGEAARVTEKLADFVGNVVLQLMQNRAMWRKREYRQFLLM